MSLPALTIDVDAKTSKYDKAMDKIGETADAKVAEIEAKFAGFDPQLNTENYTKSLTSMVAGLGLVGVGAAAVTTLVVSLNKSLADTANLADRVGVSTERLQQLKFGANALGIGDDDFNKSLDTFASNLQNAKFVANDLTRVFQANGVALKDNNGEIKDSNTLFTSAVDIIKRAPKLQDALQIGGFLGLSREFSQSIHEAGDDYLKLASQANAAGAVIDNATIQKAKQFSDEWTKAAAIWGSKMKAAIGDVLPLLNDAVNGAVAVIQSIQAVFGLIKNIKEFYIPPDISSLSKNAIDNELAQYRRIRDELAKDPTDKELASVNKPDPAGNAIRSNLREQLGIEDTPDDPRKFDSASRLDPRDQFKANTYRDNNDQSTLDVVKQTIVKLEEAQQKADKLKSTVGDKANSNPSNNPGPAKPKEADQFDKTVEQITKRTATINADTAATFQNNAAQAQYRAEFQLLNSIVRDGGEVTQKQLDLYEKLRQTMTAQQALTATGITLEGEHATKFIAVSEGIKTATVGYDSAKDSLNKINSASQQAGSALSTAFSDAIVEGKSLNDVATNLLKTLEKAAINSGFAQIFNPGVGGGLSPAANFLGLGNIGHNAQGTDSWSGGPTWVGEDGPEVVKLPRGAQVVPNSVASRGGSGGSTVYNNIMVAGEVSPGTIDRLAQAVTAAHRRIDGQARVITSTQAYNATGVSR